MTDSKVKVMEPGVEVSMNCRTCDLFHVAALLSSSGRMRGISSVAM